MQTKTVGRQSKGCEQSPDQEDMPLRAHYERVPADVGLLQKLAIRPAVTAY
jgi:hypothetical protein